MGVEVQQPRGRSLRRWLSEKQSTDKLEYRANENSSEGARSGVHEYVDDVQIKLWKSQPCISTADLRIFLGTWNVGGRFPGESLNVDLDEWLNLKEEVDIYVIGFQEVVPLKARTVIGLEYHNVATSWNMLIGKALNKNRNPSLPQGVKSNSNGINHNEYMMITSKKMVGVLISIWMKMHVLRKYSVSNIKVCSVPCGLMGYLGNKGSISVSMSIESTTFCFVVVHLASGERNGDRSRRNYQVSDIFRRTLFPISPKEEDNSRSLSILGHDRIFWFGDLNYRLSLDDRSARHLIKKQDWKALLEFDQLGREEGGVFEGWKEGKIEFAPTYKYSSPNCNSYSGGIPSRAWDKQRTPAWCDRILWYGKDIKQLSYLRSEIRFSDHRPVSALFSTHIEVQSYIPFHKIYEMFTPPKLVMREGKKHAKKTMFSFVEETLEPDSKLRRCKSSRR